MAGSNCEDDGSILYKSVDMGHSSHIQAPDFEPTVYRRRWWLLAVFSLSAMTQSMLWNTWPPIGDALLITYDWSAAFLALLLCMCSVAVLFCTLPFMYIVETQGKPFA